MREFLVVSALTEAGERFEATESIPRFHGGYGPTRIETLDWLDLTEPLGGNYRKD